MTATTYTPFELAENQLTSAIGLFVSGRDRFSVITLAGAADVLLSRLVMNQGRENFTQRLARKDTEQGGTPVGVAAHGKAINDLVFINQLKHMDDGDDGFIELDPEECALAAIAKALVSYVTLAGDQKDIVLAFKAWARLNLDPTRYNAHVALRTEAPGEKA
jgi:hypothetical protein